MNQTLLVLRFWLILGSLSQAIVGQPTKEYIRLNGRVVAIESTAPASPCASAQPALPFRSTGHTGSALVGDNSVDPNWRMVSNPSTFLGTNAIVFTPTYGGSSSISKAINATGNAANVAPGAFVYRQRLDLSCHDPATTSISGNVNADDYVQVFVNGKPVVGAIGNWSSQVPFSLSGSSGAFIKGWNQVDFVVVNTGTSPNPSQVRIEITNATATVTATADGIKFETSSTPVGGNKIGNSIANISSGSETVAWSVDGAYSGIFDVLSPTTSRFTGPGLYSALTVVPVKATSTANANRVAYEVIWFNPGGVAGVVTISGNSGTALLPSGTRTLNASVSSVPAGQSADVRWSIVSFPTGNSPNTGGTLSTGTNCSASTVYTAPSTITNTSAPVRIRAASCYNNTWLSETDVNLSTGVPVTLSLSPKTFTQMAIGSTQVFNATVNGTSNQQVAWSVVSGGGAFDNSTASSNTYRSLSGPAGPVTVRATSAANSSAFDTHSFTLTAPIQGGGVSISNPSGTLETTLTVTVNGVNSIADIGDVWINLSSSISSNTLNSGQVCRIRYGRIANSDRVQLDDASGNGGWRDAIFGSQLSNASNGVCAIIGAQSSVNPTTPTGNTLTLTLRLQNRGITGTRYVWLWTANPQNGTTAMAPAVTTASWSPVVAPVITLSSNAGNPPTVLSTQTIQLYAQVSNPPPGSAILWSLVQPDGSISSTTPPGGYLGAANYTAFNGPDRFVQVRARLVDATGNVELGTQTINVNVLPSGASSPTLNFVNPLTNSTTNPSIAGMTFQANGVSFNWVNLGVKNGQPPNTFPATSCCSHISYLQLNINAAQTESSILQDTANGCRVRINTYLSSPTPNFLIQLDNDAGNNFTSNWLYTTWGSNFTLSNNQCTVEFNTSIGGNFFSPFGDNSLLLGSFRVQFKVPFRGQRHIYMYGYRLGGDNTGFQYRGPVNLN